MAVTGHTEPTSVPEDESSIKGPSDMAVVSPDSKVFFSVSQLLTIIMTFGFAVFQTTIWYVGTNQSRIDLNATNKQVAELSTLTISGFTELRTLVSTLPIDRIKQDQLERRMLTCETRGEANVSRLTIIEKEMALMKAQLDNVRAASQPVPMVNKR